METDREILQSKDGRAFLRESSNRIVNRRSVNRRFLCLGNKILDLYVMRELKG